MDPLAGLDEVPWHELRHAYGNAANLPRLLRAVATGDKDADEELATSIVHQGTIYDSTAYAVPFVLALLRQASDTDHRMWLLVTLAQVARGRSWAETQGGSSEGVQEGRAWTLAARDALRRGVPLFLAILGDESHSAREYAFAAVARLRPEDDRTVGCLVDALRREQHDETRAAMTLELADLLDVTSRRLDLLMRALHADAASRACVAYFALRWGHVDRIPERMQEIAAAIAAGTLTLGDPLDVIAAAPELALDAIVAQLPTAPTHPAALGLARVALCLAFDRRIHDSPRWESHGEGRGVTVWERPPRPSWLPPGPDESCLPAPPLARNGLSAAQKRVLAAIASSHQFFFDPTDLLAIFGAPTDRAQLRAFTQ